MPLLSVSVAFLTLGALWLAAVLSEHGMHPMRRLAELMKRPAWEAALVASVAVGLIHHGATKGTNGVNQLPPPNPPQMVPGPGIQGLEPPAVPSPAGQTNADWLAFGACEDWRRISGGDWCFRFGTGLVERLTVFASGEVRAEMRDASNRIFVLGLPLSIVPASNWPTLPDGRESLFWHEVTASNTLLMTWQNALVNRDANLPVTVRAELFPDGAAELRYGFAGLGDASVLSNAAARIWRDGEEASVPLQTGAVAEVAFPAPQVADTNSLEEVYALVAGGDSNAYYFVDAVVSKGPARITVEGEGESTLGDYGIMAEPGVTNRLPLLIGPRYTVASETAFAAFAVAPSERQTDATHPVATNLSDRIMEVRWPVAFALDEMSSAPEGKTYALRVTPDFLSGTVVWSIAATNEPMRGAAPIRSGGSCSCGCLNYFENTLFHSAACSCDGCSAVGEYVYEGHAEDFDLPFGDGGEDPPGPDDPGNGDPPEPESSVSVNVEKTIIFFEDAYENGPGESVARRSTFCKIECNYSAAESGVLAFSVQSGSNRIILHDGSPDGTIVSGSAWSLQSGDSGKRTYFAEGVTASAAINDVVFKTIFTPSSGESQPCQHSKAITVVKMTVTAKSSYPEDFDHRHVYGVYELVEYKAEPRLASINWDVSEDGTWFSILQNERVCRMPSYGLPVTVTVSGGGETFDIEVSCLVPSGIDAKLFAPTCISGGKGMAGDIGMVFDLTLMPTNVSFAGLRVSERPSDVGTHTGYFADPSLSNMWYHTIENGAGNWDAVKDDCNWYTVDRAYIGYCYPSWSSGTMTWEIPNVWIPSTNYTSGVSERMFMLHSQTFTITADGTVSVGKFGNTVTRTTNDNITVNGVFVQ